jgi:hypothetical protein
MSIEDKTLTSDLTQVTHTELTMNDLKQDIKNELAKA